MPPFNSTRFAQPKLQRGFTLVEIMIVVVIIGLLAALAIPAFSRVKQKARINTFINDLRIGKDAFETYSLEVGAWPPDGISGIPPEMSEYMNLTRWAGTSSLGGNWDWDLDQFGYRAGLSILSPNVDDIVMTEVDKAIDDGDLTGGSFRRRDGGFIMILEF
ncbi:type II secretion system protein [Actomonas aquatica]|uniref:Prepilin-type N-terminal cleavage/methylation domain-containing protein n=1 Tax=Actomonas aquatica TaxID=2866162 RepID=A0ABZ1CEW3_9BACT|nr:prepilin-type N-terminal cleavage/methylation domain-containing protein [Opitutus sp. WL0086]WRQ89768.1 prepilin-type N-terminal cleavage/methylation domain-containing protein [Opitutus sp. WL0086]